ncbi:Crp/Fnr family transcriptional regulator [Aquimarina rhabdastrellae]
MDLSLKHHLVNFDLPEKLIDLINSHCIVKKYHQKDYFFHEGHSNNYTTLLIKGSLELYLEHIDKKILLYPLTSKQICLISLTNLFGGYPVNFSSIALEDCILLSIPLDKVIDWSSEFPILRELIIKSHQHHYSSILRVIQSLIEEPLENRLLSYLKLKTVYHNSNELSIPHQQIANDLNCSREAVSRTLKKLEKNNILKRNIRSITLNDEQT